jgi:hypothetical protein
MTADHEHWRNFANRREHYRRRRFKERLTGGFRLAQDRAPAVDMRAGMFFGDQRIERWACQMMFELARLIIEPF